MATDGPGSFPRNAGRVSTTGKRSNARTITTTPTITPTGQRSCPGTVMTPSPKPVTLLNIFVPTQARRNRSCCSWPGDRPMTHTRPPRRNIAPSIRRRRSSFGRMCRRPCATPPRNSWLATTRIARRWMIAWRRSSWPSGKQVSSRRRSWCSPPTTGTCSGLKADAQQAAAL